jgi:hypothetical protein
MIICDNNNIDIIQGVIGYGNAEGITDWRIQNTSSGVFNILNSASTTPCLSIIDNGNVGIGTIPITSSSKLEIIGDINSSSYYNSIGRFFLDDTNNYVSSTSNILVPRILTELNRTPAQWTNVSTGIYYAPTFIKSLPNIITSSPAATTNGIVETDRYMSFTYTTDNVSGLVGQTQYTFTTTETFECDILIVGGGGSGGSSDGGGGGAGGLIYLSKQIINAGLYTINVGRGGTINNNGINSSFNNYIAIGGGRGGSYANQYTAGSIATGQSGGSGGGGSRSESSEYTYYMPGGNGTVGQGFKGGNSFNDGSGGGGGAGAEGEVGKVESVSNGYISGGNGGIGKQYDITGTSIYYAGGGGGYYGGLGGLGGGGNTNQNGTNNTGGGGGGGGGGNGGVGGSGIVIIRYRNLPTTTIGIGTIKPASKLHLYDDTISETKLTIQNNINNYTGNIITGSTDKYIIFSETSSFIISSGNANCDILMIGGGGGGSLGGGGAGACIVAINQTLTTGTYSVIVGTGGTGSVYATAGNDSSISLNGGTTRYLAKGGGPGGYNFQVVNGGCGGGGGYNPSNHVGGNPLNTNIVNGVSGIGPSVTSTYVVFGTKGGTATNNGGQTVAGGGGIGMDGGNYTGPSLLAGVGGDGLYQATINSQTYNFRSYFANNTTLGVQDETTGYYFIGGGGGGSCRNDVGSTPGNGGKGGGGKGADFKTLLVAIAGTVNTGSGGGGSSDGSGGNSQSPGFSPYANGGSGIVIIRYRTATSTITVELSNSSIELIRGTENDSNRDYKIGNYNGDFIIKSSLSGIDTNYITMTGTTGAITNPTGTTSWTSASDKRIKENIERASYDKCYESINKLELNRFNYIKGFNTVNRDITQLGFIAQEVKEIFPKAIFIQEYHNDILNIPDLHSIDVSQINYLLYGTVKKLIEKVNNNVKKIEKIENILNIDNDITLTSNITSNLIMNQEIK